MPKKLANFIDPMSIMIPDDQARDMSDPGRLERCRSILRDGSPASIKIIRLEDLFMLIMWDHPI